MCISPANQYIDLREPEETHTMEVTLPQRPSTLCNRVIRCRNFYTDREKLVGKTFPPEPSPHPEPRLSNTASYSARGKRCDPRLQVLARMHVSTEQTSLLVRIATGLCHAFPLHDGSKSTKVHTVWSMRYTSCTNLGNRGPRQK